MSGLRRVKLNKFAIAIIMVLAEGDFNKESSAEISLHLTFRQDMAIFRLVNG